MSLIMALCSCPDEEAGNRLAAALVEERLAACVQTIPGLVSTYRWDGVVRQDTEVLLLIKTTRERFETLKSRLPALHPYESPELIAVGVVDGLPGYLDWIAAETAPDRRIE